jgi:hypothetical protein
MPPPPPPMRPNAIELAHHSGPLDWLEESETAEPVFEKPFKEPWNRFPVWRAGTTTLLDVPARPARQPV